MEWTVSSYQSKGTGKITIITAIFSMFSIEFTFSNSFSVLKFPFLGTIVFAAAAGKRFIARIMGFWNTAEAVV